MRPQIPVATLGDYRVGSFSIWHWIIVIAVIALLFGGRGKLSGLMGDAAKGIRAFRDGLKDDGASTSDQTQAGSLPQNEREREDANR
jgi:sec-independent protein translocase protein TatA